MSTDQYFAGRAGYSDGKESISFGRALIAVSGSGLQSDNLKVISLVPRKVLFSGRKHDEFRYCQMVSNTFHWQSSTGQQCFFVLDGCEDLNAFVKTLSIPSSTSRPEVSTRPKQVVPPRPPPIEEEDEDDKASTCSLVDRVLSPPTNSHCAHCMRYHQDALSLQQQVRDSIQRSEALAACERTNALLADEVAAAEMDVAQLRADLSAAIERSIAAVKVTVRSDQDSRRQFAATRRSACAVLAASGIDVGFTLVSSPRHGATSHPSPARSTSLSRRSPPADTSLPRTARPTVSHAAFDVATTVPLEPPLPHHTFDLPRACKASNPRERQRHQRRVRDAALSLSPRVWNKDVRAGKV